jgi:Holliday junction DNA helicase RuvA
MFAQLTGEIVRMAEGYIVLDVRGVGYKVSVSPYTAGKVAGTDGPLSLHIHTHVREDQLALYGFVTLDELTMFETLLSISGVGPKVALGILSVAEPNTIRAAVVGRDPSILTGVSGVGKKTAERIIVELQNKVTAPIGGTAGSAAEQEALEALLSLGYNVTEAREALKNIPKDVKEVGERVRAALKNLGK